MNSVDNLIDVLFRLRSVEDKNEIKRLGRPTPDLPNFTQLVKTGKRSYVRTFKNDIYNVMFNNVIY
jgi:hypothetical protein